MFERYNHSARRALFYARYEVCTLGGTAIDTEHLLLGLLRVAEGLTARIFADADVRFDALRKELQMRSPAREPLSPSIEIPFGQDTKRILYAAAAESERLGHDFVGTEHLLLSILREPDTLAAQVLVAKGISADDVREQIAVFGP